jgi:hypothetical protein
LLIYGTVKYWQLLAAPPNQGKGQPEIVSLIASGDMPEWPIAVIQVSATRRKACAER